VLAPSLLSFSGSICRRPRGHQAFARCTRWLDTWHGIGLIQQGLARQDRDLSFTRHRARWGATVFVTGKERADV
jgi:hypothetical protein